MHWNLFVQVFSTHFFHRYLGLWVITSSFQYTMSNVSASIGDLGSPFAAYFERYAINQFERCNLLLSLQMNYSFSLVTGYLAQYHFFLKLFWFWIGRRNFPSLPWTGSKINFVCGCVVISNWVAQEWLYFSKATFTWLE